MSKTKVKLNKAGVRELLKSDEMYEAIRPYAEVVQVQAGEGYVVEKRSYPERTAAAVRVDSAQAHYDNLKHNTLLKALG